MTKVIHSIRPRDFGKTHTNLIIQTQRIISHLPIIANILVLLHNQRGYSQYLETRSDIQTTVTSTNDQDGRILICKLNLLLSLLLPERMTRRGISQVTDLLWKSLQILQIGKHYVCFPFAVGGGHKSGNAKA